MSLPSFRLVLEQRLAVVIVPVLDLGFVEKQVLRQPQVVVRLVRFFAVVSTIEVAPASLLVFLWEPARVGISLELAFDMLSGIVNAPRMPVEAIENANVTLATQILHDHIIEAGVQICENWSDEVDELEESAIEEHIDL